MRDGVVVGSRCLSASELIYGGCRRVLLFRSCVYKKRNTAQVFVCPVPCSWIMDKLKDCLVS